MWHSRIFSFGSLFLTLSLTILSPVWATSSAFSTFGSKTSDLHTRIDDARAALDGFNGGRWKRCRLQSLSTGLSPLAAKHLIKPISVTFSPAMRCLS